jgi:hypothetical protein
MNTNKTQQPRVHVNFYVDRGVREKLEELAADADRSLSAEIRFGLARHLARERQLEEQR